MKYLLLFTIIAFASCKRCYQCNMRVELSTDSTYIYTDGVMEKCGGIRASHDDVVVTDNNGVKEQTTTKCN